MSTPLQHLLLVTLEDPSDPKSWSGIPHSLLCALESQVPRVTVIGGAELRPRRTPVASALRLALGPARYPLWMTEASLHHYADVIERAIALHHPDAVLSISSQCLIHLHTATPLYMFNDAPWPVFKGIYAPWENPVAARPAISTSNSLRPVAPALARQAIRENSPIAAGMSRHAPSTAISPSFSGAQTAPRFGATLRTRFSAALQFQIQRVPVTSVPHPRQHHAPTTATLHLARGHGSHALRITDDHAIIVEQSPLNINRAPS